MMGISYLYSIHYRKSNVFSTLKPPRSPTGLIIKGKFDFFFTFYSCKMIVHITFITITKNLAISLYNLYLAYFYSGRVKTLNVCCILVIYDV